VLANRGWVPDGVEGRGGLRRGGLTRGRERKARLAGSTRSWLSWLVPWGTPAGAPVRSVPCSQTPLALDQARSTQHLEIWPLTASALLPLTLY